MKVHVGKTLFGFAYTVRLEAQALASTIRKSVHRSGTLACFVLLWRIITRNFF